jgi:YD repeat-containing protein
MKAARLVVVVAIILGSAAWLHAQTAPNLENGWKPYGSYDGSHLDTVNLMNGNLMLHAPLLPGIPQRGSLSLNAVLQANSKDWQVVCVPNTTGSENCSWKNGGMRVRIQVGPGITLHRTLDKQFTDSEGLTTYVAYGYSMTTMDGASHILHGEPGTEDSNGVPTKYDTIDLTGYHMEVVGPSDSTGVNNGVIITDRQGNQYQAGINTTAPCGRAQTNQLPQAGGHAPIIDDSPMGDRYCSQSGVTYSVTDSNGNVMNLRGTLGDTLGRGLPLFISGPAYNSSDSTGCSTAHPFYSATVQYYAAPDGTTQPVKICASYITIQTAFNKVGPNGLIVSEYTSNNGVNPPATAITAIVLADGTKWTFDYDNYGEITYIGLPTGGSISYGWTTIGFANCDASSTAASRAVFTRTLDDGQQHTYQWTYNWGTATSTALTNVVKDPLLNDTVHIFTSQVPAGYTVPIGCNLYETSTLQYQGSQGSNHLLQRVDTSYASALFGADAFGGGSGLGNVFATDVVTTVYPSGKVKKVHRDPDSGLGAGLPIFGNVKKELEYDWGQGAPGALLRETDTTYKWEVDSAYLTAHQLDLPSAVIVKDGGGNRVAETDYSYDEPGYLTTPDPVVSTQHGAPPYGVRGNQTTVSRWLSTTNSFVASHTNWYDTGEVYKTIDPLGHTTTHSYDPFYKGAYGTQTCSPTTNGVAHCVSGTYDFNTGVLTSLTSENAGTQASGNTQGDAAHTSNYVTDFMWRITSAQAPPDPANNSLRATTSFNFSAPNTFPVNVQRIKSVTTALSDSATSFFDGLGRGYQSQHAVPGNTATVDTTFDGAGHAATVSNPYFTTSDPTYGTTTNAYDALDRVTQTTKQDGSISRVAYNAITGAAAAGDCTQPPMKRASSAAHARMPWAGWWKWTNLRALPPRPTTMP